MAEVRHGAEGRCVCVCLGVCCIFFFILSPSAAIVPEGPPKEVHAFVEASSGSWIESRAIQGSRADKRPPQSESASPG